MQCLQQRKIFIYKYDQEKGKMKNGSLTTKIMEIPIMILVLKKVIPQMIKVKIGMNWIKIKSLCGVSKRFYEGLHKIFWSTTKKRENKNLS